MGESNNKLITICDNSEAFWSEVKSDAFANCGETSLKAILKLFLLHSGFQLLLAYRVQKRLRNYGILGRFLGLMLLKFATDITGCHINPRAVIESGICIPHATGIVIGEGAIIRKGVTIYQNVTLGRRTAHVYDYPELKEGCIVYAGAQILGKVLVGKNTRIGANAVVLHSVPDFSIAVGIPARIIQQIGDANATSPNR